MVGLQEDGMGSLRQQRSARMSSLERYDLKVGLHICIRTR